MNEAERIIAESQYYDPYEYELFAERFTAMDWDSLKNILKDDFEDSFYADMISKFVETGRYPSGPTDNALCDYLISVMSNSKLRLMVLTDETCAGIFQDNMMRFVDMALKRKRFSFARKQSELMGMEQTMEWSSDRRRDGWQALLEQLDRGYSKYGFRTEYYRNLFSNEDNIDRDEIWESIVRDYKSALSQCLQEETRQNLDRESHSAGKHLDSMLKEIPQYLQKNGISQAEFRQAWSLMGGEWFERDFRMLVKVARRQQQYPQLLELAAVMGRTLDPDGDSSIWVGSGNEFQMEHSSKCDIQGVTVGSDISQIMPLEMVQMADKAFEDVFLTKLTTGKLQSFLHRSEQLNPNKKLERHKAKERGPMIACVDTSGSMDGIPLQIAHSLILKLAGIAHEQKRKLYVIAFSVSANPLDAVRDRVRLLDFFSSRASGDTNPTKMMELALRQLENKPDYMSADVVIIGDFRMPLVDQNLLDRILSHRLCGTRFYGLQIGMNPDNLWTGHLDKIYRVGYHSSMRI